MTTWYKEVKEEMARNKDDEKNVQLVTIQVEHEDDCDMAVHSFPSIDNPFFHDDFSDGWGDNEGKPFTVWTKDWIYFPWNYDGAEGCTSIKHNPDIRYACGHVGGG